MVSVYLFAREPLIRLDIVELLESYFDDLSITIADTLSQLSSDLASSRTANIVLMSGTTQEVADFFSLELPKHENAFVVFGDDKKELIPQSYSVSTITKPFTSDTLAAGVMNAISLLRSFR